MSSIFNQLLNVKGTVVEDVRIVDSPLRPEPVLEVRAQTATTTPHSHLFCFNVCSTGSAVFFRSVG